jgi:hypothetical protein
MDLESLNSFERDTLLRWFLHYMPMGSDSPAKLTATTRYELMRQYPAIYNKLAGREIVRVLHVPSNTPA